MQQLHVGNCAHKEVDHKDPNVEGEVLISCNKIELLSCKLSHSGPKTRFNIFYILPCIELQAASINLSYFHLSDLYSTDGAQSEIKHGKLSANFRTSRD